MGQLMHHQFGKGDWVSSLATHGLLAMSHILLQNEGQCIQKIQKINQFLVGSDSIPMI